MIGVYVFVSMVIINNKGVREFFLKDVMFLCCRDFMEVID